MSSRVASVIWSGKTAQNQSSVAELRLDHARRTSASCAHLGGADNEQNLR